MTFFDVESVKNVILNQNAANRSVLTAFFIKTLTTNVTVVWLAILLRNFLVSTANLGLQPGTLRQVFVVFLNTSR